MLRNVASAKSERSSTSLLRAEFSPVTVMVFEVIRLSL